jgi:hypothetical protein
MTIRAPARTRAMSPAKSRAGGFFFRDVDHRVGHGAIILSFLLRIFFLGFPGEGREQFLFAEIA